MSIPYVPRDYMEAAIEFAIAHEGAGLMLDPGLGKTGITLAAVSVLIEMKLIRRVLVCAPKRVAMATWPAEVYKWSDFNHLKIDTLCELDDAGRAKVLKGPAQILTINPESAHKVFEHPLFDTFMLDMLVLDESTKWKDTQTKRFKALKKVIRSFIRRLILTGTPVPNGLQDLFGQMYVVDFGSSLGKFITHFRMMYMYQRPGDLYSYHLRPGAAEQIYEAVKPSLMRLKAVDHLDMPELIHNTRWVDLPASCRQQYKELDDEFITKLEDVTIVGVTPAAVGTKCRQFANGFLYFEPEEGGPRRALEVHDAKLDELQELVDEMLGRPLLVGYEFTADADRIQARFPDAINLGKAKNPAETIERFNQGLIPILLGHPASIGHGLNIQEACHDVCWYSDPWDLELYLQFIARVWRQGQPSSIVTVHHISCRGTRDEKVAKVLAEKEFSQEEFNNALRSPL